MKTLHFLFLLLFISSCVKDGLINNQSVTPRTTYDPDVYDGMLWFSDFEHYDNYFDFLDALVSQSNSQSIDSTLARYEINFDYTSLRSVLYTDNFEDRDTATFEEDWVFDDVNRSMLNDNYEVRIEDTVYVRYSINQFYAMPYNETSLITKFRNASKGGMTSEIPYGIISPKLTLLSPTQRLFFRQANTITNPPIVPRNPPFRLVVIPQDVKCDPFSKVFVARILDEGTPNIYVNANFYIDFGDSENDSRTNTNLATFEHTYENPDHYDFSVQATYQYYNANHVLVTEEYEIQDEVIIGGECDHIGDQCVEKWIDNGSNKGMRYKLWYVNDITGQHVGSKSISFQKNGSGNWNRHNASTIQAVINAQWRLPGCWIQDDVTETESKTTAREARVSERILGRCIESNNFFDDNCFGFLNDDITSSNTITYSGGGLTKNSKIVPCE